MKPRRKLFLQIRPAREALAFYKISDGGDTTLFMYPTPKPPPTTTARDPAPFRVFSGQVIQDFITSVHFARTGNHISEDTRDLIWSIAVSIFAIGGMVGGITGGTIATKFGRKGGLLLNNIMGVAGAALMTFSKACGSYEMLILGRLVIGFNCGLSTALVPMYLSEISPITLRGGLGKCFHFTSYLPSLQFLMTRMDEG
ncbi:Glucose transporter type 1 [Araneus ventricosus]|uniref:Glucose transporter type 1 n=1 Tax=Araneus ventricosus TaxID=182803 RepID=A0A4Y2MTH0_ARAVE|nr:Glucose transporter type 1 [Araneus ventricosus]